MLCAVSSLVRISLSITVEGLIMRNYSGLMPICLPNSRHAHAKRRLGLGTNERGREYIIINTVQSYTGKYHEFAAVGIVTSAQHE